MALSKRSEKEHRLTAEEIKAFMTKNGISEQELAEILGVTIQAVTLWLDGERQFSVTNTRLLNMFKKYPTLIREF